MQESLCPGATTQAELVEIVLSLNRNPKIHGILVQSPLPKQIDERKILERIDPEKDVDGFHPVNVGKLTLGYPALAPCTPAGVIEILKRAGIEGRVRHQASAT